MKKNSRTTRHRGTKIARGVTAPLVFALAVAGLTLAEPRQADAQAVDIPDLSISNNFTISDTGVINDGLGGTFGNASNGIEVTGRPGTATVDGAAMTITIDSGAVIGPTNASTITGGAGLIGALTSGRGWRQR